jgi:hypothetical protein
MQLLNFSENFILEVMKRLQTIKGKEKLFKNIEKIQNVKLLKYDYFYLIKFLLKILI